MRQKRNYDSEKLRNKRIDARRNAFNKVNPLLSERIEAFMSCVDQSSVDRSTEEWLDTIDDRLTYRHWLCGHWHIDKTIDRFRFVMDDFVTIDDL